MRMPSFFAIAAPAIILTSASLGSAASSSGDSASKSDHDLVDLSGGGIYMIEVTDPARIALPSQVKVGDTITAVVSQALAVSIDPASKSRF